MMKRDTALWYPLATVSWWHAIHRFMTCHSAPFHRACFWRLFRAYFTLNVIHVCLDFQTYLAKNIFIFSSIETSYLHLYGSLLLQQLARLSRTITLFFHESSQVDAGVQNYQLFLSLRNKKSDQNRLTVIRGSLECRLLWSYIFSWPSQWYPYIVVIILLNYHYIVVTLSSVRQKSNFRIVPIALDRSWKKSLNQK